MNRYLPGLMAASSGMALLAASTFSLPEPAHAQFGIFIPRIGGFNFNGRGCRHCGGGRHSGDDDAGNDDSGSRKDRNDRAATLAPPSSKVAFADLLAQRMQTLEGQAKPQTQEGDGGRRHRRR